jgi:hypothetical protein
VISCGGDRKPAAAPQAGTRSVEGTYEAGQMQAGPQWQVSPHVQPARRLVAAVWHPHPQVAPEHVPHEQAIVVFVI